MNRARRTAMSVAVIIALAAIVTPPFAGALSGDDSPLLFVIKGKGTVTGDTLRVTTSTVEWFTDRPERRAGTMSTMEFRERWSEYGFEDVAPNAAIAGRDIDAVVELTEQPKMKSSRMSFATSSVRGELPRGPLGEVSVFIDATVTGTPVCTNGFGTDIEILTMAPPPSNMVVPCKNTVGVAAFATGQTPTDSTVLAHGAARIDGLEVILILDRENNQWWCGSLGGSQGACVMVEPNVSMSFIYQRG